MKKCLLFQNNSNKKVLETVLCKNCNTHFYIALVQNILQLSRFKIKNIVNRIQRMV